MKKDLALHFSQLKTELLTEMKFEIEAYRSLTDERAMPDRIKEGVTLYPIDFTNHHYNSFGDSLLDFKINPDQNGKMFGTNGKCQLFSAGGSEIIQGIILRKTDYELTLQISDDDIPEWIRDGKLGLNAVCDTRTYEIQIKAMDELMDSHRGLAFDFYHKEFTGYPPDDFTDNEKLNVSQNKAVKNILSDIALHVVHGPPGTGKTYTLTDAIARLSRDNKKILVATPTNTAADHITEQLQKAGVHVLRYGNSFKISEAAIPYTLFTKMMNHPDMQVVERLSKEADALRKKAFRFVRNFNQEAQTERKQLKQDLKSIQKDARQYEQQIRQHILESASVITGTLIGLQQDEILNMNFDLLCVDEAGQALEPAIWSLARHVDQLVLAGDPWQLPPVLFSVNAQKSSLAVSLIERAIQLNHPTTLLDTQYRMNDLIMQFSNQWFYENKLQSGKENADQVLPNDHFKAIEFIDTAGCSFDEITDDGGGISNPGEMRILTRRLAELQSNQFNIGIISPYRKQVLLLQEQQETESCYVQTIDSFQGQERDIILISLVRSNADQQLGFLKDYRRMNVAMTRARYKLVIIGDSATLGSDPFYEKLLSYIETHGSYRTAWEYSEVI